MNIKKRLEKLETVSKVQTVKVKVKVDVIRIIFEPDGTISGAIRRDAGEEYFHVSDEELLEIRKASITSNSKIR